MSRGVDPPRRYSSHYQAYVHFAVSEDVVYDRARYYYPALLFDVDGSIPNTYVSVLLMESRGGYSIEEHREKCREKLVKDMQRLKADPKLFAALQGAFDTASIVRLIQQA